MWFSSYTHQINKNEKDIEELKEDLDKLKGRLDLDEKVLNTIRDVILIRK